jgi:D-3-phosphoglycerate dehydrogenase / 2-oxoglutarate reductase
MPRVLISDKLEASGVEVLQKAGIEVDNRPQLGKGENKAELFAAVAQADALIVRSDTKVTAELLEHAGKLRAVVRAGVGVDTIDVAAATRKGIVVMNTPGGNTVSTAEQTLTLMMSMARHTPAADASVKAGKWERGKFLGTQLAGKTLGIVGLGRIGREVARRAIAFDMKVLGYDPILAPERAAQFGVESVPDVPTLLPRCDFLTVHVPGGNETMNLIGAAELATMKKGARIINCARGGIINEQALADAIRSGHIAGAALDVFCQEPPPADSPLLHLPGVVTTPHLGASTAEAQLSVAIEAAQLLVDYLTRGIVQSAVNMASVDRTELEELRLYIDLARRLGVLHSQMVAGTISRAQISYRGEAFARGTKLLTAAFAAGLLESRLPEANIVNARMLAEERGIEIVEQVSSRKGDFSTLIRAEITTDKKNYIAAGTLFGNQFLRLVQLGPYGLDTYLDGILLIFTHEDVPGMIGFIGTIFGKHRVNIAQMTVGRQKPGGEAIGVLNLDNMPSEDALRQVRQHDKITSLCVVKLPKVGEMPVWFG